MLDRGIYGCPERVAPEDDCNNNKNKLGDDYKEKFRLRPKTGIQPFKSHI